MDAVARVETTDPDCIVIPRIGSTWTDERVATVKRMTGDGYSASQIAADLGGVTRNAVIGIIHRRGFRGVSAHAPGAPQVRRARAAAVPVNAKRRRLKRVFGAHGDLVEAVDPPLPEINPAADFDIDPAQRRTLLELTGETCRWPVGDPTSPDFFFCGGGTVSGLVYCACHARRAYRGVNYFANR